VGFRAPGGEIRGAGFRENFTAVWSLPGAASQPGKVHVGLAATPVEPAGRLPGPSATETPGPPNETGHL